MSSIAFTVEGISSEEVVRVPMVIILLGPPGSGKGTQAMRIAEHCKIAHISTGELIRDNIKRKTPQGKALQGYADRGQLGPDSLVIEMVEQRVRDPDSGKGYLLDGFPRTIGQAEALDAILPMNASLQVFQLEVSDDTVSRRIAGRGEGRSDDTPEVVRERLKTYHNETKPLIDYYRQKGVLISIDGEKGPEEVFAEIRQHLSC